MKTMNSDPVQDYILEDENKLRIAVAVSDAWSEAGERLVSGFLDRLQSWLEEKLKGWEFDRWGCYLNDSDAGFDFWKPAWKAEYYVSLEVQANGEDVTFGLGRDADKGSSGIFWGLLIG
jgi:hypothetical protein